MKKFMSVETVQADEIVEIVSAGRIMRLVLECGEKPAVPASFIPDNAVKVGGMFYRDRDGQPCYKSKEDFYGCYQPMDECEETDEPEETDDDTATEDETTTGDDDNSETDEVGSDPREGSTEENPDGASGSNEESESSEDTDASGVSPDDLAAR